MSDKFTPQDSKESNIHIFPLRSHPLDACQAGDSGELRGRHPSPSDRINKLFQDDIATIKTKVDAVKTVAEHKQLVFKAFRVLGHCWYRAQFIGTDSAQLVCGVSRDLIKVQPTPYTKKTCLKACIRLIVIQSQASVDRKDFDSIWELAAAYQTYHPIEEWLEAYIRFWKANPKYFGYL